MHEGRKRRREARNPVSTCGLEEQGRTSCGQHCIFGVCPHWGFAPLACLRGTYLPKHSPLQLVSSQFGSGERLWLVCAQTALPPGPAFGAGPAYEKCILNGGPSIYIFF